MLESSKIFVEHAGMLLIYLNPGLIAVRLLQQTRFNIKQMLVLGKLFEKRKRDDYPEVWAAATSKA